MMSICGRLDRNSNSLTRGRRRPTARRKIKMAYTKQDLSPYSTHLLAQRTNAITDLDHELEVILLWGIDLIRDAVQLPRGVTDGIREPGRMSDPDFISPWEVQPTMRSTACVYEEERPVTWLP